MNIDRIYITNESIYSLGIQLLKILEQVHSAGFIYNDLKFDNLLLDFETNIEQFEKADINIFDSNNINIIDFGYATSYLEEDGKTHIQKEKVDFFRGNMIFASSHQLKFNRTSRRDDLISVFYILIYLLKQGNMPGIEFDPYKDVNNAFEKIT